MTGVTYGGVGVGVGVGVGDIGVDVGDKGASTLIATWAETV